MAATKRATGESFSAVSVAASFVAAEPEALVVGLEVPGDALVLLAVELEPLGVVEAVTDAEEPVRAYVSFPISAKVQMQS